MNSINKRIETYENIQNKAQPHRANKGKCKKKKGGKGEKHKIKRKGGTPYSASCMCITLLHLPPSHAMLLVIFRS